MSIESLKSNKYAWMVVGVAVGVGIGYVVWGMKPAAPAGGAAA